MNLADLTVLEVVEQDPVPACFDSEVQYKDWRAAARNCSAGRSDYCRDCTRPYQSEMIVAGRCEYPGTVFVEYEDKNNDIELVGVRPMKERVA